MWANHPEVTEALVADGRSSLIGENRKDSVLEDALPSSSQNDLAPRSRSTARRPETKPVVRSSVPSNKSEPARERTQALDSKSLVRKRWESALDQAIAPIVEDDPADLASDQADEVLPANADHDSIVRQLEDRLSPNSASSIPGVTPSQVEARPASGDASEMARDLLKQVIPQGGQLPRSVAPRRDLGHGLLNAPAPGQGAAAQAQSRIHAQSQLIQVEPF